jgi:uncharacterized protein (TIGR03437 family)
MMNQLARIVFTGPIFGLSFLLTISANAQSPAWSATGALSTARSLHTATPLSNGKVLVVGGINILSPCCTNTGNAELYDPATGQWTATGNPSTPRANHIAARLASGKVLIASGNGAPFSNILNTAEIYDPATGNWTPAGNLNVARQSPRAALLADGRVLVTGGLIVVNNQAVLTNTAEVYDPATNVWTPTPPMNSGRVLHTVTLLPNGKVLAAGGSAASFRPVLQRTAELYDPATNTWTLTGEMTTPRVTHSTTLLANGKVLVTGGSSDGSSIVLAQAELYDPATGQWSATGNMTSLRVIHSLTLLPSGFALAAGGSGGNVQRSAELYNPATGTWTATVELAAARQNHTATLLPNGKLLVTGGSGAGQLTSAELYDSGAATVASVSAASFAMGGAPESIVAAFGSNLAAGTQAASGLPLPTSLAGTSLRVRDSAGVERPAPLFFVAPNQINYQIPAGTAAGTAYVSVVSGGNPVAAGIVEITRVAPGLFSANASGQGVAAAVAFRLKADGTQSFEPVARFDSAQNRFVAVPIDLGPETDQVFLILYGTGIKLRGAQSAVSATIGGATSEVLFADAAPGFAGLDQVNMRVPRSLGGRGEVDVTLVVDARGANTVRVSIR